MCTFGVLGFSCEAPAAPKPPGFHTTAREPKRAHLRVPVFTKTTKIQRENNQWETKRAKFVAGDGKKSAKFWAVRWRGVRWRGVRRKVVQTNNHTTNTNHNHNKQQQTPHEPQPQTPHGPQQQTTNNHKKQQTHSKTHTNTQQHQPQHNTTQHRQNWIGQNGLAKMGWPNGLAKNGLAKIGLAKVASTPRPSFLSAPAPPPSDWHFWEEGGGVQNTTLLLPNLRIKARNGNRETSAVVKNQVTKQRGNLEINGKARQAEGKAEMV